MAMKRLHLSGGTDIHRKCGDGRVPKAGRRQMLLVASKTTGRVGTGKNKGARALKFNIVQPVLAKQSIGLWVPSLPPLRRTGLQAEG